MKVLIALILLAVLGPALQEPQPFDCKVTGIENGVVTLQCADETILGIPLNDWPEKWAGEHKVDSVFRAKRIDLHLFALPTDQYEAAHRAKSGAQLWVENEGKAVEHQHAICGDRPAQSAGEKKGPQRPQ